MCASLSACLTDVVSFFATRYPHLNFPSSTIFHVLLKFASFFTFHFNSSLLTSSLLIFASFTFYFFLR